MFQVRREDERMITRERNRMEGGKHFVIFFVLRRGNTEMFFYMPRGRSLWERREVKCGGGKGLENTGSSFSPAGELPWRTLPVFARGLFKTTRAVLL